MAMYPNGLYAILETLDECQIPYGGGGYRHLAVSPNGVPVDELQEALTHVIDNGEYSSVEDDALDELGIGETPYGFIRSVDGLSIDVLMNQQLCGYREDGFGKT